MNALYKNISLGVLTALLFSAFIYAQEYNLSYKLFNTLSGLLAFTLLLYIPKKATLFTGFLIGIFWFYWIGYSFEYQGVGYMQPIITLFFGIVYLIFFLPLYFTDKPYLRAIFLFLLSFFEPFDWNWMQLELLFVESYIGIFKWQFAAVLTALALPSLMPKSYKFAPLFLLLISFNYISPDQRDAPLTIKLVNTDVKQEFKWTREALSPTVAMIFQEIEKAKQEGYELVVFPESVFPLFMNHSPKLIERLQAFSYDISIVAGTLLNEDGKNYNVTYLFENGNYFIAKKLVLVPFGEYIPLPEFARKFVNDTFFNGASDFITAKSPTDFNIRGTKFRNAICYEATCEELYEGDVKYIIATSNNAWFTPSIEPILQNLLLKFYARKHDVTIYHSANYKGSGVIK
ncbi:MAG: apolipoprotein N-acyltransferase [Campylobacterales bacterium]|nr:apolipoprotein N-acyltransferase [Campylobacterales bacterium]